METHALLEHQPYPSSISPEALRHLRLRTGSRQIPRVWNDEILLGWRPPEALIPPHGPPRGENAAQRRVHGRVSLGDVLVFGALDRLVLVLGVDVKPQQWLTRLQVLPSATGDFSLTHPAEGS